MILIAITTDGIIKSTLDCYLFKSKGLLSTMRSHLGPSSIGVARKARMMNSSANNAQCLNKVTVAHNRTQAVSKHLHYVQTFL